MKKAVEKSEGFNGRKIKKGKALSHECSKIWERWQKLSELMRTKTPPELLQIGVFVAKNELPEDPGTRLCDTESKCRTEKGKEEGFCFFFLAEFLTKIVT